MIDELELLGDFWNYRILAFRKPSSMYNKIEQILLKRSCLANFIHEFWALPEIKTIHSFIVIKNSC